MRNMILAAVAAVLIANYVATVTALTGPGA